MEPFIPSEPRTSRRAWALLALLPIIPFLAMLALVAALSVFDAGLALGVSMLGWMAAFASLFITVPVVSGVVLSSTRKCRSAKPLVLLAPSALLVLGLVVLA